MASTVNRKNPWTFLFFFLVMLSSLFFFPSLSDAAKVVGNFSKIEGEVEVLLGGAPPGMAVKTGDSLHEKDMVRTKAKARAEIRLVDGTFLVIDQRSRVDISEYVTEKDQYRGILKLPYGKVEAAVNKAQAQRISTNPKAARFEIHTPHAVAGVRGTVYSVLSTEQGTEVLVSEGIVGISILGYPEIFISVGEGQLIFIPNGTTPTDLQNIFPRTASQEDRGRFQTLSPMSEVPSFLPTTIQKGVVIQPALSPNK